MDYTQSGFDQFFQREVIIKKDNTLTDFDFSSIYQQESQNIKNKENVISSKDGSLVIDLDKGILQLTSSGENGKLIVKSSTNKEILSVKNDQLLINNSDELPILDSYGIVSMNNFKFGKLSSDVNARTILASQVNFVDIPATSFSFHLPRQATVLFFIFLSLGSEDEGNNAAGGVNVVFSLDNNIYPNASIYNTPGPDRTPGPVMFWYRDIPDPSTAYTEHRIPAFMTQLISVKEGVHTGKLQWKQTKSTNNMMVNLYYSEIFYLILGA